MISRRSFLLSTAAAGAILAAAPPALASHTGYTIGVIRWDAYYGPAGGSTIRGEVETSLSPLPYQSRSPACGVTSNTATTSTVSFAGCATQAAIDAEINAAASANIDYFAACWYGASSELSAAWNFYQSSAVKAKVGWCWMYASLSLFVSEVGASSTLNALVGYLGQSNWPRVTVGGTSRPLLYLLIGGTATAAQVSSAVSTLKSACSSAGVNAPYVILLDPPTLAGAVSAYGVDAIGSYGVIPTSTGTYATGYTSVEGYWATISGTGQPMIPTAVTGWDTRPRKARPHEFQQSLATAAIPFAGMNNILAAGTPTQIATHIGDMVTWIKNNASACPAQTGLIYSWNEHDEGGSTLNPTLGGSAILTAVGGGL